MSVKNLLESHMLTHSNRSSRKNFLIDPILWNIIMLLCSCKLLWKVFETYFVHTRIVNKLVVGLRVTAMIFLCEEVKLNYLYFNKRFSIKKLEPKYIKKLKKRGLFCSFCSLSRLNAAIQRWKYPWKGIYRPAKR